MPDNFKIPFSTFCLITKVFEEKDSWVIGGYASVEVIDKQDDIIPVDVLKAAWNLFTEDMSFANIHVMHTNIPVGKIITEFKDEDGKVWKSGVDATGLFILVRIRQNLTKAKQTWELIKKGKLRGFSIAGEALLRTPIMKGLKIIHRIDKLELFEISIVDNPANTLSLFSIMKAGNIMKIFAKRTSIAEIREEMEALYRRKKELQNQVDRTYKEESKDPDRVARDEIYLKMDIINSQLKALEFAMGIILSAGLEPVVKGELIGKPFAGYKNMKACIRSVSARKNPPKNPAAYCASIHHRATGKWPAEKYWLGEGIDMEKVHEEILAIPIDIADLKVIAKEISKLRDVTEGQKKGDVASDPLDQASTKHPGKGLKKEDGNLADEEKTDKVDSTATDSSTEKVKDPAAKIVDTEKSDANIMTMLAEFGKRLEAIEARLPPKVEEKVEDKVDKVEEKKVEKVDPPAETVTELLPPRRWERSSRHR